MAFKNIFGSTYAIVENVTYNGPQRYMTFDLVMYRDSHKEVETGRMQYRVNGNLTTFEIESVITAIPSGLEYEAMPDDFDFDAFDDFKPYLIGNNPTAKEFTAENESGELKTGFQYVCEHVPIKSGKGLWPHSFEDVEVEVANPLYVEGLKYDPDRFPAEAEDDMDSWNPKTITQTEQRTIWHKIKYEWGALHKSVDCAFLDSDGDYWVVSGDTGSVNVQQIDKPFLDTDWDTWFSAASMDAKDKNLSERIYTWLKTKAEYKDAVKI